MKSITYPPNPNRQVQEQVGFMASEDGLFLNIFWNDIGQKEVDLLNGTVLGVSFHRRNEFNLGNLCLLLSNWPIDSGIPGEENDFSFELVGAPLQTASQAPLELWRRTNSISSFDNEGTILINSGQFDYFSRLTIVLTQTPSTIIHSIRQLYLPVDLIAKIQNALMNQIKDDPESLKFDPDNSWLKGDKWIYSFETEKFARVSEVQI